MRFWLIRAMIFIFVTLIGLLSLKSLADFFEAAVQGIAVDFGLTRLYMAETAFVLVPHELLDWAA